MFSNLTSPSPTYIPKPSPKFSQTRKLKAISSFTYNTNTSLSLKSLISYFSAFLSFLCNWTVAKNAIVASLFNSSSFIMFEICLDITDLSLSNNSAICSWVNQTVSSWGLTLTSKLKSPSSNLINSYLFSRIIKLPRKVI